ncbi:MAG: hypothetical protein HYS22_01535 [Deltaproteobacteria bacterium]|nr:hypothetical protein [Deltaproteobacteria bacterium]
MAKIVKELSAHCPNKVGTFAKACGAIKEANVNIEAACAWGEKQDAVFHIVTANNTRAKEALEKAGFQVEENEVVMADLAFRVGSLAEASQRLAGAGIDVNYCYCSTGETASTAHGIFNTKDNKKAAGLV